MNIYRKVGDQWLVRCPEPQQAGATVTVTLRDGRTKTETLGERVGEYYGDGLYAVVKAAPAAKVEVGALDGVLKLFEQVKGRLKRPAIVLSVPDASLAIRLNIAGPKAKVPGSLTVLDAERGEDGRDWFGRITLDGQYQPSRSANGRTEAIVKRLREFAADPAGVAAEHGKTTGRCCFCSKPLGEGEDKRSVEVGYGAKCAKNYRLPFPS